MDAYMLKANESKLGNFYFKKLGNKYLITNQAGDFSIVTPQVFEKLVSGKIDRKDDEYIELKEKGFIRDRAFRWNIAEKFKSKNLFLFQGPSLFIVVLSTRCNLRCTYCHASAKDVSRTDLDMDMPTAKRVVDVIFSSPSVNIGIEFQGGEPLLNWDVLKFIVDYAIARNKLYERNLMLNLVTNMTLLNNDKLKFLLDRKVGLCTSLDGPGALHDKHRGKNSAAIKKRLKETIRAYKSHFNKYAPAALTTVTRDSLAKYREIIDEYIELGMMGIHLRQLNPIGFAGKHLDSMSYSPEEFIEFYEKALDYIIEINKGGTYFVERTAWVFLMKIFSDYDPNFLDLRCPCGAGTGQIAFNYDGNVYTCDEGRMLAMMGDDLFKMGNVMDMDYDELIQSDAVKTLCLASLLEGIPKCESCAYKPYCGVCPLLNYVEEGNIFSMMPANRRHKINEAVLDMLFMRIQDESIKDIFFNWLEQGMNVS